jgi:hypothetical protein
VLLHHAKPRHPAFLNTGHPTRLRLVFLQSYPQTARVDTFDGVHATWPIPSQSASRSHPRHHRRQGPFLFSPITTFTTPWSRPQILLTEMCPGTILRQGEWSQQQSPNHGVAILIQRKVPTQSMRKYIGPRPRTMLHFLRHKKMRLHISRKPRQGR